MKKMVLIISCSFILCNSFAQKFMHAVGNTTALIFGKVSDFGGNKSSFSLLQTSISYFPRFNFIDGANSSVSIGSPISGGVGFSRGDGDAGVFFAYDLPVAIDYNFGCNSSYQNYSRSGGYIGIGYGYYKVGINQVYSDFNGSTQGPILRAGYRQIPKNDNYPGRGITIGLFLKKGIDKDKMNTIGLSLMYDM